jgi:hypothetical protein
MRTFRFRLFASMAVLAVTAAVAPGAAVAGQDGDLEELQTYWLEAYAGADGVALSRLDPATMVPSVGTGSNGRLAGTLLAKAEPDECFYGLGDPRNAYGATDCDHGTWKVNQAYVWGLTERRNVLWFGTAPNVHCLVVGTFLGQELPHQTDSWVCEFGESNVSPPLPGAVGDWRPPQIFSFDTRAARLTERTPDDPRIASTLGIRSAGSLGRVVFLAGPALLGGINVFAFDTKGGAYLGSASFPEYDNIRKWLADDGALYTAVGSAAGGGRVLRWTGTRHDPFHFDEVGILGSEGAELEVHEGHLFVSTWPDVTGADDPATMRERSASLWMSPNVPEGGLTNAHAGDWEQVWSALDYEPDPVTAMVYGGGALASFEGELYWGTMHVPLLGAVAHFTVYGSPADDLALLTGVLGTHRAISIFRGDDFGTADQNVDLLYGMRNLPAYDPIAGEWRVVPNVMGERPRYGPAGAGNFFNNYTWTMDVFRDDLFVGTMDWSYLFRGLVRLLAGEFGLAIPETDLRLPFQFFGADLLRFRSRWAPAMFESSNGVGNYTSYGIRTMVSSGRELYLGMANPMNLLTDPMDGIPEGGWELIRLMKRR